MGTLLAVIVGRGQKSHILVTLYLVTENKSDTLLLFIQNTVSTDRVTSNVTLPEQSPAYDVGNDVAPPPYSLRTFSPPPTYSVAMRNAPPPDYSEVLNISIEPTLEPPPAYDTVTRSSSGGPQ